MKYIIVDLEATCWENKDQKKINEIIEIGAVCINENKEIESELLRQFEDRHWDLPVLNSTRGYGRDTDKHYRE